MHLYIYLCVRSYRGYCNNELSELAKCRLYREMLRHCLTDDSYPHVSMNVFTTTETISHTDIWINVATKQICCCWLTNWLEHYPFYLPGYLLSISLSLGRLPLPLPVEQWFAYYVINILQYEQCWSFKRVLIEFDNDALTAGRNLECARYGAELAFPRSGTSIRPH